MNRLLHLDDTMYSYFLHYDIPYHLKRHIKKQYNTIL
jgi:hypothetical protein